jgi:hypothetical protein
MSALLEVKDLNLGIQNLARNSQSVERDFL